MDEPWPEILDALQRLCEAGSDLLPIMITQSTLQRVVDECGADEAKKLLERRVFAFYQPVEVKSPYDWTPAPKYLHGDLVKAYSARFEAISLYAQEIKEPAIEIADSPNRPAHNAPNRRRFKRNSRKR